MSHGRYLVQFILKNWKNYQSWVCLIVRKTSSYLISNYFLVKNIVYIMRRYLNRVRYAKYKSMLGVYGLRSRRGLYISSFAMTPKPLFLWFYPIDRPFQWGVTTRKRYWGIVKVFRFEILILFHVEQKSCSFLRLVTCHQEQATDL